MARMPQTAVNALVEVPWNDCALLPVPVMSINAPPSVAEMVNAFALATVLTKTVPPSVIPVPASAVPPPARYTNGVFATKPWSVIVIWSLDALTADVLQQFY